MDVFDDDDDDNDGYMYMGVMPCSCMEMNPPPMEAAVASLLGSEEESLVFGEAVEDRFFNLFFIVEFQKFSISLSVRPGKRAAI